MLAPLKDLVGKCGYTKVTKKMAKKKKIFHWEPEHWQSFEKMKQLIACDVVLAYPHFELSLETNTDASD